MAVYDAAVIGLGAMGSAALYHLARRGRRVIGIEQFEPGHDRGSSHGDSRAIRLGYSEHPSYVPLVRSAFDHWRALERQTGEAVLTTTGILEAGRPGSRMVAGSLEACRMHGLDHEILGAREIERRFPAINLPDDYTGIWQPDGGFVNADLANALHLKGAREAGATVMKGSRVAAIEPGAQFVRIVMKDRVIEAASVVVAAGPWMTDLVPQLAASLVVTRQVLCWYEPLEAARFALGALPLFMIEGEEDLVYGFPDFSGAGLKCASHYGSGPVAHASLARQDAGPADEARTRQFLERYLPAGAGRLKAMKTCLYTMTPDEDFVIDLASDDQRIVVASACSGHGFKFASVIGEILADLALDRSTPHDISRFCLGRFSPP